MKQFFVRHRHLVVMLLLAVIIALFCGYVCRYKLSETTQTMRTIVNDDYTQLSNTLDGTNDLLQNIAVKEHTTLYGVNLVFTTFERVCQGFVTIDLLDASGSVIATCTNDMSLLLDNAFTGFLFDRPVFSTADTVYALRISAAPATQDDCIAVWHSETIYPAFELIDADTTHGPVGLQYIVEYTENYPTLLFVLITILLLVGAELVYWMCFVKKCRTEHIFAVGALFLGCVFCLFTPINGGPDENAHLDTCYHYSNSLLGIHAPEDRQQLYVRSCDTVINRQVTYGAFSLADMSRGLFAAPPSAEERSEMIAVDARVLNVYPLVYLPQTLGVTLARVLGLGFVPLVLFGRLFNLLFYIALVYMGLKLMPVCKTTLALCALLPMSMQLAGNFCYDVFVLALSFLFIAAVLHEVFNSAPVTAKAFIRLAVLLALLTPAKAVYVTLGLLVLLLPNKKFTCHRNALICKCLLLGVAVAAWGAFNIGAILNTVTDHSAAEVPSSTVTETQELHYPQDLTEDSTEPPPLILSDDLQPNGDSKYYYSIGYILRNPVKTLRLVIDTIFTQSSKLLESMVGTRLGELIVIDLHASTLWFTAILAILYLSVLPQVGQVSPVNVLQKTCCLTIFSLVLCLVVAACIMWTPINYTSMFGLQGRYLLPVLPLLMLALPSCGLRLSAKIEHALPFALFLTNIGVLMNVFLLRIAAL